MANFQDILAKPAADIKPPKTIPVGTYLAIVDGQGQFVKVGKQQTDAWKATYKLIQAQTDVDQAALLEALEGKALSDVKISQNWFITEAAVYRLKDFLVESLGIEEGTKGLGEMIPEAMGKQLYLSIGHRPSEDGKQIFAEVKSTAKV